MKRRAQVSKPPPLRRISFSSCSNPTPARSPAKNTLFYVLAGAVLADLALGGHVKASPNTQVTSVENHPRSDDILRSAWDYVSEKPRGVQAILPAIGPTLRGPLLERLIERGDIRRRA